MPFFTSQIQNKGSWPLRSVYLLVATLLFGAQMALAGGPSCFDIFSFKVNNAPIEILAKDEVAFMVRQVRKGKAQNFAFLAFYDKSTKSIEIRTMLVDYARGERSAIKGHDVYREMMEHFSSQDVRIIRGNWSHSDNSRAYIDNIRNKKMTPEEAALNTWSGQQAAAYGYSYPKVIFEGFVENTYKIDVDFYKEPPRTGWRSFFFGP